MPYCQRLFACIFVFGITACGSKAEIVYKGFDDDGFLQQLSEAPSGSRIEVSLGGSDLDVYLRAIDIINSRDLKVHIVNYCINGCANYLFPGVKKISSTDHALIAFSQTYTFQWMIYKDFPKYQDEKDLEEIKKNASKEIYISDFYKENPIYLLYPSARRGHNCIPEDPNEFTPPFITGELNLWSVTDEGLRVFNPAYKSSLDMNKVLETVTKIESTPLLYPYVTIKFDTSIEIDQDSIDRLYQIGFCD